MTSKAVIGWREWLALPALGIPAIKAKIDTGARTSALHTFALETYTEAGREWVRFRIHPLRRHTEVELECIAPVIERRVVRDSGGHAEERIVIATELQLDDRRWPVEISLTSRDDMLFRMLLGRAALRSGQLLVDPAASYVYGRGLAKSYATSGSTATPDEE